MLTLSSTKRQTWLQLIHTETVFKILHSSITPCVSVCRCICLRELRKTSEWAPLHIGYLTDLCIYIFSLQIGERWLSRSGSQVSRKIWKRVLLSCFLSKKWKEKNEEKVLLLGVFQFQTSEVFRKLQFRCIRQTLINRECTGEEGKNTCYLPLSLGMYMPALMNTDAYIPGWYITSFFLQLQWSCFSSCITMGKREKEDVRVPLPGDSSTLEYGCRQRIQNWLTAHPSAQWSAVSNTDDYSTQLPFMWHKRSALTKCT